MRGKLEPKVNYFSQLDKKCRCAVKPGCRDIGLYDISPITSYILWYQLIPNMILLGYNDARLLLSKIFFHGVKTKFDCIPHRIVARSSLIS